MYTTLLLPQPQETTPTLTADVEFGVLTKDGDCILTGICRVSECLPPSVKRRCRFAPALFCAAESGQVQCFFPKALMRPCVRAAFFDGEDFVVPLPVPLPAFVAEGLGLPPGATVLPGLYSIGRTAEGYELHCIIGSFPSRYERTGQTPQLHLWRDRGSTVAGPTLCRSTSKNCCKRN